MTLDRSEPADRDAAGLLEAWKRVLARRETAAREAAVSLRAETTAMQRVRALDAELHGLALRMAAAPAGDDAALLAKLELWRLLVEAEVGRDGESAVSVERAAQQLVLSVAAALAARG